MRRRRFLQVVAAAVLAPGAARAEVVWNGHALGADVSLILTGPRGAVDRVLAQVPQALAGVEAAFSLYDPASEVSRLNTRGSLDASPMFHALCVHCDRLHALTGGIFDPTVQPLWRALAEGHDIAAARAAVGWPRLRRDGPRVTLAPGQALTFNGIAQGFATDRVCDLLAGAGFTRALVHIGEHAALGGPWRIGIADPLAGLLAERALTGGAMASSSPAATLVGGGPHILHPVGLPPRWSTVTVEADTATLADGLSTALVFLDRAAITALRAGLPGLRRVTLIDDRGDLVTV